MFQVCAVMYKFKQNISHEKICCIINSIRLLINNLSSVQRELDLLISRKVKMFFEKGENVFLSLSKSSPARGDKSEETAKCFSET